MGRMKFAGGHNYYRAYTSTEISGKMEKYLQHSRQKYSITVHFKLAAILETNPSQP